MFAKMREQFLMSDTQILRLKSSKTNASYTLNIKWKTDEYVIHREKQDVECKIKHLEESVELLAEQIKSIEEEKEKLESTIAKPYQMNRVNIRTEISS